MTRCDRFSVCYASICVIYSLIYLCPMNQNTNKTVLILGANSDVAKECIKQYIEKGFSVMAASRNKFSERLCY
jgi:hypothetical protein